MSTCGEVGSDVHALIKELAIRRVEHRSQTNSNESQHLAEGTEVARLRRRLSFVLQQALSFRTRNPLCRQEVALASTRQLRSQSPVSVHAPRTEGVTKSEGREETNGDGIGVGGGNGIGGRKRTKERKVGAGTGPGTGGERGRGWRPEDDHRMGTGTGAETETRAVSELRTETRMGTGTGTRTGSCRAAER